jgi:hypothetical protein
MEDNNLKKQIKEMEAQKRAEILSNSNVSFIDPNGNKDTVSYDQWWMVANKKLKLSYHIKEIILADFKGRGYKTDETMERFNEALSLFGYKI